MKLYDRVFKPQHVVLENGKTIDRPRSRTPLIIIVLLIAVGIAIYVTGANFTVLRKRGHEFFAIFKQMVPPKTSYIPKIWTPLFDTIKMSVLGSIVGCTLALPFSIVASSNIIKNRYFVSGIRFVISIVRTLPTLVIALLATFVFGLGTMAGTVAISVFTFGIVVKMLYEQIETVDMGAFEAVEAMGATKLQSFLAAVLPQVLPYYLATCLYCFEMNVRSAAILGYVGAGGIGLILNEKIGWREYSNVGMILLMLYITVVIIESLSKYLRAKLS